MGYKDLDRKIEREPNSRGEKKSNNDKVEKTKKSINNGLFNALTGRKNK